MKTPAPTSVSSTTHSARSISASALLLAAALALLPSADLGAANLYWDANGTAAGAGATPTGTWGTDSFWNSDSTGADSGSFTSTTTGSDMLFLSAGPTNSTNAYTITVDGTRSASGLTFQSVGKVTLAGGTINLGAGGITIPRTVFVTNDAEAVQIDSAIALQASQTWSTNTSKTAGFVVNGTVTGTGNLTLSQSANRTFNLTNSVNHTGTLTGTGNNSSGIIDVSGDIGANVTNIIANGTTTLRLSGNNNYSGNVTIGGTNFGTAKLTVGSATALATGSNVTLTATNASAVSTLNLGNAANSYSVTVAGLNTAATTGGNFVTNDSTGTGTATLTIDSDAADTPYDSTFAGVIKDGATAKIALAKAGAQTLTLTGANTYTGDTTVSGGTLLINGSLGSTAVSVGSGGTLGGDGTLGGSLHFDAGAKFIFSLTDTLTVNGTDVSFGGFGISNLVGLDSSVDFGTYTLIDGAAAFNLANVANTSLANAFDLGDGKVAYFQSGSLNLVVAAAIPEPSAAALVGGLIALVGVTATRRQKRVN